jgi:hypothetical protein
MAAKQGRRHRQRGIGCQAIRATVRLLPESLEVAERAADALGVSRDTYLDMLLARERARVDELGRPTWWPDPVEEDQEVLPLQAS